MNEFSERGTMEQKPTSMEIIAPDLDTAIARAQEEFGVPAEDLEVEVLDDGNADGGLEMRVRVLLTDNEPGVEFEEITTAGCQVISQLLSHMEIEAEVSAVYEHSTTTKEDPNLNINIEGEDLGILIGRRGETIAALQYVARIMMRKKLDRWVNLIVDVCGYKNHREQQLHRLAHRMAQQVNQFGRPISLEPMLAYERRIIHMTLQDNSEVHTESSGDGSHRHVTITPELLR